MQKISWTNRVRNKEELQRVKEERNILRTIETRKANWIGHILLRNYFLDHIIKGKAEKGIEATVRKGRRRKQLLYDFKETRGYWKLKEETLDRTLWRTHCGRSYAPVAKHTTQWMNKALLFHTFVQFLCFLFNILTLQPLRVWFPLSILNSVARILISATYWICRSFSCRWQLQRVSVRSLHYSHWTSQVVQRSKNTEFGNSACVFIHSHVLFRPVYSILMKFVVGVCI